VTCGTLANSSGLPTWGPRARMRWPSRPRLCRLTRRARPQLRCRMIREAEASLMSLSARIEPYRADSVVTLLPWIPPYASCACASDILSSPRPIRAATVSANKRPMFSLPRGRFDPLESLNEGPREVLWATTHQEACALGLVQTRADYVGSAYCPDSQKPSCSPSADD
jgi:hypothetical protein